MAQYSVKSNDVQDYTLKLIRYAIHNRKADIVNMLQSNGISVSTDVSDTVLEAMVLKAMISSKSFKYSLIDFLQSVAIEGEHKKGKYLGIDGQWYNQDGTQSKEQNQEKLTISNDTFNGLITKGIDVLAYKLTDGNLDNQDATNAKIIEVVSDGNKDNRQFKNLAISVAVVGGVGIIIWYLLKNKK